MDYCKKPDYTLLLKKQDGDVTIICEDGNIKAHKFILSFRCEYFAKAFSWANESKKDEITLDYTREIVKLLLLYIYDGTIDLSDELTYRSRCLSELFSLAQMLCFEELCGSIIEVITVDIENGSSEGFKTFKLIENYLSEEQNKNLSFYIGEYLKSAKLRKTHHCGYCCDVEGPCEKAHFELCKSRQTKEIVNILYGDNIHMKIVTLIFLNMTLPDNKKEPTKEENKNIWSSYI